MEQKIKVYEWTDTVRVKCMACEEPSSATLFAHRCRPGLRKRLFCKLNIDLPVEHFHWKCPDCGYKMITCQPHKKDPVADYEIVTFVDSRTKICPSIASPASMTKQ